MATDDEKSRSELKESEEKYRCLFEATSDAILIMEVVGQEARVVDCNERTCVLFGCTNRDQIIGCSPDAFSAPTQSDGRPSTEKIATLLQALSAGESLQFEWRQVRVDGPTFLAEVDLNPIKLGGKPYYQAVVRDITERRRSEEELRKLAAVVRHSGELVNLSTLEGKMVFLNEAGGKMLGLDPDAIENVNILEVIPEPWSELVETDLLPALMRGDIWEGDLQYKNLETGALTDVHAMTFTVKDPDTGRPALLANVSLDITERKRAEEERLSLERQVQQAQKLESLGVLAGGIAHDFNNLLVGILGNAELALLGISPESPARERILDIEATAKRAAELTGQMLAYSGRGRFIVVNVDLQTIVEEMVHLLEVSITKKASIVYEFGGDVPPVEADATQLRQVVMNLVVNASESLGKDSGVISIRVGVLSCDRTLLEETYLDDELEEGVYAFFEVADTGCGMDTDTQARIFDPFFTTKFTGRGLGLAAVLGIVRGHKGAIQVYSEPAKGTAFRVYLPASSGSRDVAEPPGRDVDDAAIRGKRIMLVDDEDTIRDVGREMLERLGAEVTTASDGREALELFGRDPGGFDCVILDLTMPHMDGEETCREMRLLRADVCVVLSSGYSQQELKARIASEGFASFIQKPYQSAGLLEALLEALGSVR